MFKFWLGRILGRGRKLEQKYAFYIKWYTKEVPTEFAEPELAARVIFLYERPLKIACLDF